MVARWWERCGQRCDEPWIAAGSGRSNPRRRERDSDPAALRNDTDPPPVVPEIPKYAGLHQEAAYRESVIPSNVHARVTVEQASTFGWERYAGLRGATVGMSSYGASAPLKDLQKKFGFTVENVVAKAEESIKKASAK